LRGQKRRLHSLSDPKGPAVEHIFWMNNTAQLALHECDIDE
jgi:hypothetical protein